MGMIPFKTLERIVGFLVYVAQTYTSMVPYLKGIYLILNSWRHGQDAKEWTIPKAYWNAELRDDQPPKYVKWVPRLKCDVVALMKVIAKEAPPDILVRATNFPSPCWLSVCMHLLPSGWLETDCIPPLILPTHLGITF